MRKPIFRSQGAALLVGLGGMAIAWLGLRDAYDSRGRDTPAILRPFTWW